MYTYSLYSIHILFYPVGFLGGVWLFVQLLLAVSLLLFTTWDISVPYTISPFHLAFPCSLITSYSSYTFYLAIVAFTGHVWEVWECVGCLGMRLSLGAGVLLVLLILRL